VPAGGGQPRTVPSMVIPGRRSATSRATYYLPRTIMLFGDAKDVVGQVVKELEAEGKRRAPSSSLA